jgi:hypothetical protein
VALCVSETTIRVAVLLAQALLFSCGCGGRCRHGYGYEVHTVADVLMKWLCLQWEHDASSDLRVNCCAYAFGSWLWAGQGLHAAWLRRCAAKTEVTHTHSCHFWSATRQYSPDPLRFSLFPHFHPWSLLVPGPARYHISVISGDRPHRPRTCHQAQRLRDIAGTCRTLPCFTSYNTLPTPSGFGVV